MLAIEHYFLINHFLVEKTCYPFDAIKRLVFIGYYAPVIFLGALLIILVFLVFLHWLAQYWLDSQEKANMDGTLDSDDSEYESLFEKFKSRQKNKIKRKKAQKKQVTEVEAKRLSIPQVDILKAASETSSVSEKGVKLRSKNRLAVSLSVKHTETNMLLSGMIKGVTGLQFPDHGGPDKIRFKMNLKPRRTKKTFKTQYHIPLDSCLIIPFLFKLVTKKDLNTVVIHLRLFGKKERLGILFGSEHCYGEAFISLTDLAAGVDEINIVQEIIPLGSKPFNRESMKIRVASPKITTKKYSTQQIDVSPEEITIHFNDSDNRAVGVGIENAALARTGDVEESTSESTARRHERSRTYAIDNDYLK